MRVLITGDRGFVGSATTQLFEDAVGYDLMDGRDIRDREQLEAVVSGSGVNRILHLAAVARFAEAEAEPLRAYETNVLGTRNVVEVAERHHIPLVYASTGSVYMPITEEPPITEAFKVAGNSVYACSKLVGEAYVRRASVPWIILRYAHLYGPEKRMHGLIGGFVERIERGLAPRLYGGQQSNDFCYVDDIARANLLAVNASHDRWNQVYNIGTGQELTTEAAGRMICDAFGYSGAIEIGAQRTVDADRFVYDISKARNMLGWEPQYDFAAGLGAMAGRMEAVA